GHDFERNPTSPGGAKGRGQTSPRGGRNGIRIEGGQAQHALPRNIQFPTIHKLEPNHRCPYGARFLMLTIWGLFLAVAYVAVICVVQVVTRAAAAVAVSVA